MKKNFDSHGGVWIFKSFLRSSIVTSYKVKRVTGRSFFTSLKWAGRDVAYLRSNIVTSYKVKKG